MCRCYIDGMECLCFFPLKHTKTLLAGFVLAALVGIANALPKTPSSPQQTGDSAQRVIGAIKAITNDGLTLTSDAGEEIQVTVQDATRILRVAPGEKDLKNATPLQRMDLQVGDRVLVRGKPASDSHAITAAAVIVMKQSDVVAKQEQQREDWQKRGVGGLVTAVDSSTGALTIAMTSFAGSKSVVVRTTKNTILRRYAATSVKFDDARIAPLDEVKVGDQLRARGAKNEDGSELAAEEVVSGTFRNLAGTITAIDVGTNTLTLKDVLSKQSIVVQVTADAQLRKLPAEFAQRIATRLKGAAAGAIPGAAAAMGAENTNGGGARNQRPTDSSGGPPAGGMGGMGAGRRAPPDIQQILSRMPPATLADLQKGDAVMIVSTQGDPSGAVRAITLVAGVEPILTASPGATQALMLSPWSLSSAGAEAAANP
jgi:co-chaperonin GroES (HSP10)